MRERIVVRRRWVPSVDGVIGAMNFIGSGQPWRVTAPDGRTWVFRRWDDASSLAQYVARWPETVAELEERDGGQCNGESSDSSWRGFDGELPLKGWQV